MRRRIMATLVGALLVPMLSAVSVHAATPDGKAGMPEADQRGAGAGLVVANSCAAQCRAEHNKCRIRTKGDRSCDAALNACLQSCRQR